MDFLTTIIIVGVSIWVGWHVRGIALLARFGTDPDHFIKILQELKKIKEQETAEIKSSIIGTEVKAEHVQGFWYAYAADSDQFLGQGPTLEDALKMASDRFPDKKFWCKKPNEFNHSS